MLIIILLFPEAFEDQVFTFIESFSYKIDPPETAHQARKACHGYGSYSGPWLVKELERKKDDQRAHHGEENINEIGCTAAAFIVEGVPFTQIDAFVAVGGKPDGDHTVDTDIV